MTMPAKGLKKPEGPNRYKSRLDGLYYNGYLGSPDAAQDAFGECMNEIATKLRKEIQEMDALNEKNNKS